MANSKVINYLKTKFIKDIINNEEIVIALNSPDKDNPDWEPACMIDNPDNISQGYTPLLFSFQQNPNLINKVLTIITVKVSLKPEYSNPSVWSKVILEISVFSHNEHMRIDNIPRITANRNDYLGELIDEMINNKYSKIGKFKLSTVAEGAYSEKFYYKNLVFEGMDLNYSQCNNNDGI